MTNLESPKGLPDERGKAINLLLQYHGPQLQFLGAVYRVASVCESAILVDIAVTSQILY
jgi:hypothetical protein